jgi:hypothetical protein
MLGWRCGAICDRLSNLLNNKLSSSSTQLSVLKMDALLSREDFKIQVLARSRGKCVFCGAPAVDAHHILDRKLFVDGGYRLSNGAAVCAEHHWRCETTELSVEAVIAACGLSAPYLPEGFDPARRYDKWGNEILQGDWRLAGPLFNDDGARKALAKGGVLWRFVAAAPAPD